VPWAEGGRPLGLAVRGCSFGERSRLRDASSAPRYNEEMEHTMDDLLLLLRMTANHNQSIVRIVR
jgi:hypothetical protein